MSNEKLIERLDELITVMGRITEDLRKVVAELKGQSATPAPAPKATSKPASGTNKVEDIKMMFPEDLEALLNIEDKGDYIRLKPRQFLASENFAKIASVVRGLNGEYISAGKDSHFRVPK